jgi:hypothetical protein
MNEQDKQLVEWLKQHTADVSVGGMWMPEGSGLTYIKEDEKTWRLTHMIDDESVENNHIRMKTLLWDIGINMIDDNTIMRPTPTNEREAHAQELHMKREMAQQWADTDGTRLVDMDLENTWPEYIEDKEILLDNGETTTLQIWEFRPLNPNTGEHLSIDPDDYHLLMGDKYFMRFRLRSNKSDESEMNDEYHALSREEMIEYVNSKGASLSAYERIGTSQGCAVGSTSIQGLGDKLHTNDGTIPVRIPPWMWGTFCMNTDGGEEE